MKLVMVTIFLASTSLADLVPCTCTGLSKDANEPWESNGSHAFKRVEMYGCEFVTVPEIKPSVVESSNCPGQKVKVLGHPGTKSFFAITVEKASPDDMSSCDLYWTADGACWETQAVNLG